MRLLGLGWSTDPRGIKLDACAGCGRLTAHAVAKRFRWLYVLALPLVRVGSEATLVCGACGATTPLDCNPQDVAGSGRLKLQKPRPEANPAWLGGSAGVLPATSIRIPESAVREAVYERRLEEVLPVHSRPAAARYATAWPGIAIGVASLLAVSTLAGVIQSGTIRQGSGTAVATPATSAAAAATAASPTPRPTATPLPTPRPFAVAFDYWTAAYTAQIEPCYSGGGACNLAWQVQYTDGTSGPLSKEVARLAAIYRDNDSVSLDYVPACRQEQGSMFALLAAMASEGSVLAARKTGDAAPAWRPVPTVQFEPCTTSLREPSAALLDLRTSLAQAAAELVKVDKLLSAKNWSKASAEASRLGGIGLAIARCAARDYPDTSGGSWSSIRAIGWDLVEVSQLVQVKRLAGSPATAKKIDTILKAIKAAKV